MTARPLISVFEFSTPNTVAKDKIALPGVFKAPIRLDIVNFVHSNLNKNRRQPHGVNPDAGMKHSAESWGTGRAVARIPRVSGSGTHRSGQGAFGNMCRKGRMFAPLKTWRRWYRRVNIKQKRHAVASALAASAITALVQARGHRVHGIPELPLVVDNKFQNIDKTREAVQALKTLGAYADIQKVVESKSLRAGKGKLRNRRFNQRKGPLVVYGTEKASIRKALRNVPGVDTCHVSRLNLLQLAPGGQLGRFIIWTADAFSQLNKIFGTFRYSGTQKSGYTLQRPLLSNADLARIINSNEVQSVVNPAQCQHHWPVQKKNPLNNTRALDKLNPFAKVLRQKEKDHNEAARKRRQEALKQNRGFSKSKSKEQKQHDKKHKKSSSAWLDAFKKTIKQANDAAIKDEIEFRKDV